MQIDGSMESKNRKQHQWKWKRLREKKNCFIIFATEFVIEFENNEQEEIFLR